MNVIVSLEQNVLNWLDRDRTRRVTQQAVRQAYASFAARYPRLVDSLFDEYFVERRVLPALQEGSMMRPLTLARAWTEQFHYRSKERQRSHARQLAPYAAEFLALVRREMSRAPNRQLGPSAWNN